MGRHGRDKLYFTGGLGSRHSDEAIGDRYELPSERAYSETCAAIATHAVGVADVPGHRRGAVRSTCSRRSLYNAYAVGLSADGTALLLRQPAAAARPTTSSVRRRGRRRPLRRRGSAARAARRTSCAGWPNSQDHIAAEPRRRAASVASTPRRAVDTEALGLTIDTDYPWDGDVRLTVDARRPADARSPCACPAGRRTRPSRVDGEPADAASASTDG